MSGDETHLTLAHSPDPDDAFMWWPLVGLEDAPPVIDTGRFSFSLVTEDIEQLNGRAEERCFDITAISIAQYPRVASLYDLTACGASVGEGYGPKLVARDTSTPEVLLQDNPLIAVPGERTTALATLRLLAADRPLQWRTMPFDRIMDAVRSGEVQAGVVIHEGQLTFENEGLTMVADLGDWWMGETGLPLPLGGNAIARDLDARHGAGTAGEVTGLLVRSIKHAMDHRDESLRWAATWGRGLDMDSTDRFVEMYVNHWTLDFGARGREAVAEFLSRCAAQGILPEVHAPVFVSEGRTRPTV